MVAAQLPRRLSRPLGFVMGGSSKGNIEGVNGATADFGQERSQRAGVYATAEQRADRDVTQTPAVDGGVQCPAEALDHLGPRCCRRGAVRCRGKGGLPVAPHSCLSLLQQQQVARRQPGDAAESGAGRRDEADCEEPGERHRVGLRHQAGQSPQQGPYLRSAGESVPGLGVVKGLDPQPIADQQ